jgi:aspartate ammonia-lyase
MQNRDRVRGLMRSETDALGEVDVPFSALYGAQTERAQWNFPVSGISIGQFPELIRALAHIKAAAARVNVRFAGLSTDKAVLIERVCDEIIAGQHHQHFPVDVFQGGAGTSTNMNMNEVIANRGLELMGLPSGDYAKLHPNDDVNRSQSTNDVYPTALRLALMTAVSGLMQGLLDLAASFEAKGVEFALVAKLGRTNCRMRCR